MKLRNDETILAKDEVSYLQGIVPVSGTIQLSNQRILFYPTGITNRLGLGKEFSIELDNIEDLALNGKTMRIKTGEELFRFSGYGAIRLHERVEIVVKSIQGEALNLTDSDILNENVLIQGNIDIFVRGPITTKGQIILSQQRLRIESISSLETLVFTPKNISTTVEDIVEFEYQPTNRILKIQTENNSIRIIGKLCTQVFLYLQAIKDGSFNLNTTMWDVSLYQGFMGASLGIQGFLVTSSKHILFCASSIADNFVGSSAVASPLKGIHKIELIGWSMEMRLQITTTQNDKIIFGANDIKEIYQSLYAPMCSINIPPPFKDLRYLPKISQRRVTRKLKPFNLELINEKAELIDWCVYRLTGESMLMGWLLLTTEHLRFLSPLEGEMWKAPIKAIQKLRPNRQHDPLIQLVAKGQKKIFIPQGGSHLSHKLWSIITGIKPEQEAKIGRPGQSIRRVIGRFRCVNILKEEQIVLAVQNVEIEKIPDALRLMLPKQPVSPVSLGETIQVEVPRNEGRFRFQTRVKENYIAQSDPIGRYYATFSLPQDIVVFNKRTAFRVSFTIPTIVEMFTCDAPAKLERYYLKKELYLPDFAEKDELVDFTIGETLGGAENFEPVNLLNDFKKSKDLLHLGTKQSQFNDISLGGCSVAMQDNIEDFTDVPLDRIFFRIDIAFDNITLPILARITNSRLSYENPNYIIYGCQFFNLHQQANNMLKIEVLNLEREQVRAMISIEEINAIS
ncbi:MAG: PilZ domain-containing protein [Myxococcota bacterium]|nr:PilZ domain-containing protein [Myxococcota bacterium]